MWMENAPRIYILTALSQPAGQIIHIWVQKPTQSWSRTHPHMLSIQVVREGTLLHTSQELQTGIQAQGMGLKAYRSTTPSLTSLHSTQLSTVFAYQQIINKGNKQKIVALREEINDVPTFHYVAKGKIQCTSCVEYQSCSNARGIFYCRIVKSLQSQHNYTNTPVF